MDLFDGLEGVEENMFKDPEIIKIMQQVRFFGELGIFQENFRPVFSLVSFQILALRTLRRSKRGALPHLPEIDYYALNCGMTAAQRQVYLDMKAVYGKRNVTQRASTCSVGVDGTIAG